jgi:NAD+ diphosphatase
MSRPITFCPRCATSVEPYFDREGRERLRCPACGYTHWGNPVPVVAAIVEHGDDVVLVQAVGWPDGMFGLVTGFLERAERPEDAVLREVREELSVDAELVALVGLYPFEAMNQLLIAYHVRVPGEQVPTPTEELVAIKRVPRRKLRPWPYATGLAVADWLARAPGEAP